MEEKFNSVMLTIKVDQIIEACQVIKIEEEFGIAACGAFMGGRGKSPTAAPSVAEVKRKGSPTRLSMLTASGEGVGRPPTVVERRCHRCLVCNKEYQPMCRRAGKGVEVVDQVSYLLEQCLELPQRKCKEVAKKIVQESEREGGREGLSLFCPTHESMVTGVNDLSLKVTKLVEVLEANKRTLKTVAGKWISGDEPVKADDVIGQMVKNAFLRSKQKNLNKSNKEQDRLKDFDENHLLPQSLLSNIVVNNGSKPKNKQSSLSVINNGAVSTQPILRVSCNEAGRLPSEKPVKKETLVEQRTSKVGSNGVQHKRRKNCGANKRVESKAQKTKTSPGKNAEDADVVLRAVSEKDEDVDVKVLPLAARSRVPSSSISRRVPSAAAIRNSSGQVKAGLQNETSQPYPCNESIASVITSSRLPWSCKQRESTNCAKECLVCPELFDTATERNDHYRTVHGDGINFVCYICKRLFATFRNLKVHLTNLHNPEKPYACRKCGIRHETKLRLDAHAKTHLRQPSHVNQSSVRAKSNFVASKKLVTTSSISQNYRNQRQTQQQSKHICLICKNQLPDSTSLKLHVQAHHRRKCNKCSYECLSAKFLRRHVENCQRESENPPEFSTATRPGSHCDPNYDKRNINKGKIGVHVCGNCDINFETWCELKKHKRVCGAFQYL